jgi:serine/threonine-protein kinase
MLFELLTGRLPFTRDETMDVLFAHATENPPTFGEAGASDWAPPEIEAVVMRCLAKSPNDRPGSARDLAEEYQKALKIAEDRINPPSGETPPPRPAPKPEAQRTDVVPKHASLPFDANVVVHQLEAWMPDIIATNKLRGFVQDNNGEVLESVPGKIKMRIGAGANRSAFSWLGIGRKAGIVDLELRLERNNPSQQNLLRVIVLMSSPHRKSGDPHWRERCDEVFCELRSHLAATVISE